jgi:hypothetical protein
MEFCVFQFYYFPFLCSLFPIELFGSFDRLADSGEDYDLPVPSAHFRFVPQVPIPVSLAVSLHHSPFQERTRPGCVVAVSFFRFFFVIYFIVVILS